METTEKKKYTRLLSDERLKGTWELKYKLVNEMGPEGFSGRMLGPYPDPTTGRERFMLDVNNQPQAGCWIEQQITLFHPDTNPAHARVIDWLVGHNEVGVINGQVEIDKAFLKNKVSNPRFTLVNLDYQDISDLENDDYIDKLVGRISLDNGKDSVGLDKLRWVLAQLDMDYRDVKYITDSKIEKQKLRHKLKTYVRSSIENAKKVDEILGRLQQAKYKYEIKEMIRFGILVQSGGMFIFNGNPIGTSHEAIINHWNNNPEFYADLQMQLANKLKAELNEHLNK